MRTIDTTTLVNIAKKYRVKLRVTTASYSDQIYRMKEIVSFSKPPSEWYNGERGGRTGWDYLYVVYEHDQEPLKGSKLRSLKKALEAREQQIVEEYYYAE